MPSDARVHIGFAHREKHTWKNIMQTHTVINKIQNSNKISLQRDNGLHLAYKWILHIYIGKLSLEHFIHKNNAYSVPISILPEMLKSFYNIYTWFFGHTVFNKKIHSIA